MGHAAPDQTALDDLPRAWFGIDFQSRPSNHRRGDDHQCREDREGLNHRVAARPGLVVIDIGSIAPLAAREINDALAEEGVAMLGAPVRGGSQGNRRQPVGHGRRRPGDLR
jgi:NAD binding domain of 6-phosphogluconate dehydrogenase